MCFHRQNGPDDCVTQLINKPCLEDIVAQSACANWMCTQLSGLADLLTTSCGNC